MVPTSLKMPWFWTWSLRLNRTQLSQCNEHRFLGSLDTWRVASLTHWVDPRIFKTNWTMGGGCNENHMERDKGSENYFAKLIVFLHWEEGLLTQIFIKVCFQFICEEWYAFTYQSMPRHELVLLGKQIPIQIFEPKFQLYLRSRKSSYHCRMQKTF